MLTDEMTRLLVRELRTFQREVEMYPDDASLWTTLPGVANSTGNLAAHLAGNLQYFVGARLGNSGYVRDREREFQRREGTRAELVADLQATIDAVEKYLPTLTADDLARDYPEPVAGVTMNTGIFLLHLCAHAAFHLGQADYLRRALHADARTAGTLPLKPLGR